MKAYGLLVPIWVQAIIIFAVIFILGRYGRSISMKWMRNCMGRALSTLYIDSRLLIIFITLLQT
ncbi:hypothetical protein LA20531_00515 [Lactobacillus amylovorus DSM 20531]|nr:hypothetical protein LA20531_00515 [Lactobacillus amylovorus DSM 20531]MCT3591416.1 hypothetical protein [Lactobacillus amylovorus]